MRKRQRGILSKMNIFEVKRGHDELMHLTKINTTCYLLDEVIIDYSYISLWPWLALSLSAVGVINSLGPQALVIVCLNWPPIVRILCGAPNNNQSPRQDSGVDNVGNDSQYKYFMNECVYIVGMPLLPYSRVSCLGC